MATHKIPAFISSLPKGDKERVMEEFVRLKESESIQTLVTFLERKLNKLVEEEEKSCPLSWFQSRYTQASNLAERKALREIISFLK